MTVQVFDKYRYYSKITSNYRHWPSFRPRRHNDDQIARGRPSSPEIFARNLNLEPPSHGTRTRFDHLNAVAIVRHTHQRDAGPRKLRLIDPRRHAFIEFGKHRRVLRKVEPRSIREYGITPDILQWPG